MKDEYADPECRAEATNKTEAGIDLGFKTCGITRRRSVGARKNDFFAFESKFNHFLSNNAP